MGDPIVILLAIIAVLLFAILLAVCPACRQFLGQSLDNAGGCLVAAAIFLVPIGAVVWLGVWLVRTYGFSEVAYGALFLMLVATPIWILMLIIWMVERADDKRVTAEWEKRRAHGHADNEKGEPAEPEANREEQDGR